MHKLVKKLKIKRLLWDFFFPNDPKAVPHFHQESDGSKKKMLHNFLFGFVYNERRFFMVLMRTHL